MQKLNILKPPSLKLNGQIILCIQYFRHDVKGIPVKQPCLQTFDVMEMICIGSRYRMEKRKQIVCDFELKKLNCNQILILNVIESVLRSLISVH